jgi:hypothetical protein
VPGVLVVGGVAAVVGVLIVTRARVGRALVAVLMDGVRGLGRHLHTVARGRSSRPYGPWDNGRDVRAAHDCGTQPTMCVLMTTDASADSRPAAR